MKASDDKVVLATLSAKLNRAGSGSTSGPKLRAWLHSDTNRFIPGLVHLATRYNTKTGQLAVRALADLVHNAEDNSILFQALKALPRKGTQIAKVAVSVTEAILAQLPQESRTAGLQSAQLWNNLSERNQDASNFNRALDSANIAIEICHRVEEDTLERRRVFAQCLLTRCKRFSERRYGREALKDAEDAWAVVNSTGPLATPDELLLAAQIATVLINRQAEIGRFDEGLASASIASDLLSRHPAGETLVADRAFLELAWANILTHLGRHEESLAHSNRADHGFRILNAESPDEFLEFSAAAAAVYSQNLQSTGKIRLAYDISTRAVELFRVQAAQQPKRFGREFAAHLLSASDCASDLGLSEESLVFALDAVSEARNLGRRLRQRDFNLEGLTLLNLFNRYYYARDLEQALKAIRSSVRCLSRVPISDPERPLELARALRNYAELERVRLPIGEEHAAVRLARKSLMILAEFSGLKSEAILLLEAHCRSSLANCLEAIGNHAEAISEEQKSLNLRRLLFAESPVQYRADVAFSLLQVSRQLLAAKRFREASEAAQESIAHYEQAFALAPESSIQFYAQALGIWANVEAALGKPWDAKSTLERAIKLVVPYYDKAPSQFFNTLDLLSKSYLVICESSDTADNAA